MDNVTSDLADDLLTGTKQIAAFTGKTERQIYHMAEKKQLKGIFKIGRIWHGRKSTLKRSIAELEATSV
jgi:hypothetical protein